MRQSQSARTTLHQVARDSSTAGRSVEGSGARGPRLNVAGLRRAAGPATGEQVETRSARVRVDANDVRSGNADEAGADEQVAALEVLSDGAAEPGLGEREVLTQECVAMAGTDHPCVDLALRVGG